MKKQGNKVLFGLLLVGSVLVGSASIVDAQTGGIRISRSEYRVWKTLHHNEETGRLELARACGEDVDDCELYGAPERQPWAGWWWSYSANGIANEREDAPSKKLDQALKATLGDQYGELQEEALQAYMGDLQGKVHPFESQRRAVVDQLNRLIAQGKNYRDCSDEQYVGDYGDDQDASSSWVRAACIRNHDQPSDGDGGDNDGDGDTSPEPPALESDCTCPWNQYQELGVLIEEARSRLTEDHDAFKVDTATEFEHLFHGRGVAGVEGWWGHCNAWSAAAIMEPQPVKNDQEITFGEGESEVTLSFGVADVKAYLTEAYMDLNSAFYGTRAGKDHSSLSYDDKRKVRDLVAEGKSDREILEAFEPAEPGEGDEPPEGGEPDELSDERKDQIRAYITYFRAFNDVTPADFHILFSMYLTKLHRGFVIDRYTGEEVWNQPVKRVRFRLKEIQTRTEDGRYPVVIEVKYEWATDGVSAGHIDESVEVDDDPAELDRCHHCRSHTYTLYLEAGGGEILDEDGRIKPSATIVGPGKWGHAASTSSSSHPDFIWVPVSNAPPARRSDGEYYENPFVGNHFDFIKTEILPHVINVPEEPDEPEEPGPGEEGPRKLLEELDREVGRNEELAFTFEVPEGMTTLRVEMETKEGDPDLYLRHGEAPTKSDYDCRPYLGRGDAERCAIADPRLGTYHVMVRGYSNATFDLKAVAEAQAAEE